MRNKDFAEKETDVMIEELEKKIAREYSLALKEMKAKFDKYSKKFEEDDEKQRKKLEEGKITEEDYKNWRVMNLYATKRYKQMADTLASDLVLVDKKAMSLVTDYLPEAYALNFNYSTYEIEQGTSINTSFTLYSRETVEKLLKEEPNLLPKRKVDVPKDKKWNKQHIDSAILQGILQGDSIDGISDRLQQVTDMDRRAAIRNARTMMTGAQNGGRIGAYERASNLGIEIQKEWMATLDKRTRDSHAQLDGERVPYKKAFSNGLNFPGDPDGDPSEVYNCRCTIVPFYPEYADMTEKRMTYGEWVKERKEYGENVKLFDSDKIANKKRIDESLSKEEGDKYLSLSGINEFYENNDSLKRAIVTKRGDGKINVKVETDKTDIILFVNDDKKEVYIDLIYMQERGTGIGTRTLKEIAKQAKKNGYERLTATCAGSGESEDNTYVGYYALARFGFDAKLTEKQLEKVHEAGFVDAFTVQDMMETEEKRKWWKKHGWLFEGVYRLK